MNSKFVHSLDNLLRGVDKRDAPRAPAAQPKRQPSAETPTEMPAETVESRHRKWFVHFAAEHVMPLLTHTVEALKQRGIEARCRLNEDSDTLAAELVIVSPGLAQGARPPQLAIAAAPGPRGLSIDYTGVFPNAAAEGGFGAEVIYDNVYTSELEEQVLEFVRLATGA